MFRTLSLITALLLPIQVFGGLLFSHPYLKTTVDAYLNLNLGDGFNQDGDFSSTADNDLVDFGARLLTLHALDSGVLLGARIAVEASSNDAREDIEINEASLLAQGDWGRLEIGERQGLPDVLTGFAPNNYTFTSSEYGPATGINLNPAGGLQSFFIDPFIAIQINNLNSLGFNASLSANTSEKIIYAAPRTQSGFISGISYAPDIGDDVPGFKELIQTGLTYDYFFSDDQLHIGGSFNYANGDKSNPIQSKKDLKSLNLGMSMTFNSALNLGLSATRNGNSGRSITEVANTGESDYGWVFSVNYNKGPWTYGGFYQSARGRGDENFQGSDRLQAFQLGLSYRFNIRTRLYAAGYHYEFDDESSELFNGDVLILGIRIIL